jgi:Domain of unknown function (DUF4115)
MARLRVRMELNRGGVGVPLQKLAQVVDEAQKFFHMLGEDVHIASRGEWLGFDFDNKSLNFTAEYVGGVEAEQVREFHAAFDGVTLLRRATIAQFARIADAIEEDELIGFGLYQSDQESEPSEWRSLSKREALRITEEIRLLLDRTGESEAESRIPAALDPNAAASLFRDRRQHGIGEPGRDGLAARVERLEQEVSSHTDAISSLRGATVNTEQNLQKLLVAVDSFCDKAARQMERLPAPEAEPEPAVEPAQRRSTGWRIPLTVAAVFAIGGWVLFHGATEPRGATDRVQAAVPAAKEPAAAPAPIVAAPKPVAASKAVTPSATGQRVELKAIEPSWVSASIDGKVSFAKLLDTDQTQTIDSIGTIRVRLGNAGGVQITANGKPVGAIGRKGQVKTVEFSGGGFRVVPPESAANTPR